MSQEGWQKVADFSVGSGMIKDRAKTPSAKEAALCQQVYEVARTAESVAILAIASRLD